MKNVIRGVAGKLSGIFFRGLVITFPITLTIALLYWLATTAEHTLGGLIDYVLPGWYRPGMGIVAALAIVFLAGMLMSVWITRQLMFFVDRMLERIPLVKSIYGSLRDVATLFAKSDKKNGFKKVVAVRVAEKMRVVGFVTVEDFPALAGDKDEGCIGVYVPMGYQIGGFTLFVPKSLIEPLEMSVEDAMRFTLTAGISGGKAANGKSAAA